jgi:hypothetical protein
MNCLLKLWLKITNKRIITINAIEKNSEGEIIELEGLDNETSFIMSKFSLIKKIIEYRERDIEVEIKTCNKLDVALVSNEYFTTVSNKGSTHYLTLLPKIQKSR